MAARADLALYIPSALFLKFREQYNIGAGKDKPERSTSHIPGAVSSVISAFNGSGYISADLYKEC